MVKFHIFHANQTSVCLDPYQNLRVRLVDETSLSPRVILLLAVPRLRFFCVFYFCFSCLFLPSVMSVYCSLVITSWERAGILALLYEVFSCAFFTFPYGVLGQVWYLIAFSLTLRTYTEGKKV